MSNINNNPAIGTTLAHPNPMLNSIPPYAPCPNVANRPMSLRKQNIILSNPTIGDIFNVEIGWKYWAVVNCNYMMECDIVQGNSITCNHNKTHIALGIDTPYIAGMIDIFSSKEDASRVPKDLYRRDVRNATTIGTQYLVSIGMKCWAVIDRNYYECTIVEGSGACYSKDGRSVAIGIDSSSDYFGILFNLYHYDDMEQAELTACEWESEYRDEDLDLVD